MRDTAGEVGMNSEGTYSCGPLHMDEQRQDGQPKPTYYSSVPIQDVTLKTCRKRWLIEKGGSRGSEISARHDDDDDIYIHACIYIYYVYMDMYVCIYIYIYKLPQIVFRLRCNMRQVGFSRKREVFSMKEIHAEPPFPCDYVRNDYCKQVITSTAESKQGFFLNHTLHTKNED